MKLYRPYVPLAVRIEVAERQLIEAGLKDYSGLPHKGQLGIWLKCELHRLFRGAPYELHHRPALVNRPWNKRKHDYDPPANSPEHLVYLAADDHDIETRVHGIGAQRSDLGQRRYNKRVERNRDKTKKKPTFRQTTRAIAKHLLPKSKSQWPRKIANRKFRNPSALRGLE